MSRQEGIHDSLFEKWTTWIERVYDETVTLFAYRSFYRGLAEMTQANDEIPASSFFGALGAWYATTQVMAVRRQADTGRDAVWLARLLTNMADNPQVMTRERFLSLWGEEEHWRRRANEQYDRYADGADPIPAENYRADLDRFQEAARPVKDYVDRPPARSTRADSGAQTRSQTQDRATSERAASHVAGSPAAIWAGS